MKNHAALYLRSSKDRKDVSIQDQRELLTKLAADRGFVVVREYVDVVESGKDEDRPGFQSMLIDLDRRDRGWQALLCRDTSRLARNVALAGRVDWDAKKRGVEIVYASIPESDPITQIWMLQINRAADEVHSIMSRQKGLAGMRQNVSRGFRAGGRAPWGYRLKQLPQGIVRDGKEICKTALELSEEADKAGRYLQLRADGIPRGACISRLGITDKSPSTLIGVEWNALTYSGCTVWNVHNEMHPGGYQGKPKRRPRSEWVIKEATHPALITREQAEKIIRRLELSNAGKSRSEGRAAASDRLLAGLLQTPEGETWKADRIHYRTKTAGNRYVRAEDIEQAVVGQLLAELKSDELLDALIEQSRKAAAINLEPKKRIQAQIASTNATISKAMTAALMLEDPAPAYRKIDELERTRKALTAEMAELEEELQIAQSAATITRPQLKTMLDEFASQAQAEDLKLLLSMMIERVVLDPQSLTCQMHYRIKLYRPNVASLRGFEPRFSP